MVLTHGIWQIKLWCTRSKWNMGEILAFLAKNDDEKWSRKNIFENPPCAHHVIFITEFWSKVQTRVEFVINRVLNWLWFHCAKCQRKKELKTLRLELCTHIVLVGTTFAKNEKRQFFSKSAKNIHGLKLTLVPLCQMPKEQRAENFQTWAMYTHRTCWHICMNYLRRMYVVSFHKSFLSTHIYVYIAR